MRAFVTFTRHQMLLACPSNEAGMAEGRRTHVRV